jgi:putative transposase
MPVHEPIVPGKVYHLYNHANGNLPLFRNDDNFMYFLSKYALYVHPYVDTLAYCLMPNHFHFAVRIKEQLSVEKIAEISNTSDNQADLERESKGSKTKDESHPETEKGSDILKTSDPFEDRKIITNAIKNWLISYTQAYHKMYSTKGNLFRQKIRRKQIKTDKQLLNLIAYIHLNPVHHKFVNHPLDWAYSSYSTFFSNKKTLLMRDEVIGYFDNIENMRFYHDIKIVEMIGLEMDLSY